MFIIPVPDSRGRKVHVKVYSEKNRHPAREGGKWPLNQRSYCGGTLVHQAAEETMEPPVLPAQQENIEKRSCGYALRHHGAHDP